MKDVTAIIKTFQRPAAVRRLVKSIRTRYPELPILVGDDSKHPEPVPDTEHHALPFDCGLSAGRNALVDLVRTKYFLLLDDDFVFTHQTRIELLQAPLEDGLDLVSGRVNQAEYHGLLHLDKHVLHYVPRTPRRMHNGWPLYDMTWNFFLARTERVKKVRWDEDLKLSEHTDFFLRAKRLPLLITHLDEVDIGHIRDVDNAYAAYRQRASYYAIRFLEKHGLAGIVNYDGKERSMATYIAGYDGKKSYLAPH